MRNKRKLREQSATGIFRLWQSVPQDLRLTWLTPSELRDQLVAGGVASSLDESQVSSVLSTLMKRGLVSDHRLKTNARLRYYRLSEFDNNDQVPLTQRQNNRQPPSLSDGYFKQEKLGCAADLESVEAYLSSLRTTRNQGQQGNRRARASQQEFGLRAHSAGSQNESMINMPQDSSLVGNNDEEDSVEEGDSASQTFSRRRQQ